LAWWRDGFDAPWNGGSGFDVNLGDGVGFHGRLHDHGFDYSLTWHEEHGGYSFDERGSGFDGNLGGGALFEKSSNGSIQKICVYYF
jgi:hypothetical protein